MPAGDGRPSGPVFPCLADGLDCRAAGTGDHGLPGIADECHRIWPPLGSRQKGASQPHSNQPDSPIGHAEVRSEMGMRPGGFGILLTRQLVDDVIYNEKGNEVLLIKYMNGVSPVVKIASGSDLF